MISTSDEPRQRLVSLASFHLAGLVIVLTLPSQIWLREPVWTVQARWLPQCILMGVAYLAGVLAVTAASDRARTRALAAVATMPVSFGLAYALQLLRPELPFSRGLLLVAGVVSVALATGYELSSAGGTAARVAPILTKVIAVSTVAIGVFYASTADDADASLIRTAYHPVQLTLIDSLIAEDDVHPGGAIRTIGTQVVGVTGAGAFYALNQSQEHAIIARRIELESPGNFEEFDATVPASVSRQGFRVLDFVTRPIDDGWEVFAAHHYWVADRACLVVRVSRTTLDRTLGPESHHGRMWEPLWETRPCMQVEEHGRRPPLAGIASGGRLAWLEDRLLMTVGDLEKPELAQLDSVDYGKTVQIDTRTGVAEVFTRGHRNPQGLFVDADGSAWSTEHGPMGGDELNLLRSGVNYGWPATSYGTDYGRYVWQPVAGVAAPPAAQEPVFSWVPSIGVANLIRVRGDEFSRWKGDFLVASLKGASLFRLRIVNDRVVYSEAIPIGRRIRDLVEDEEGTIWLWGENVLATLDAGGAQERGDELLMICTECHLVESISGMLGPTLLDVVGRRVAGRRDFEYSEALRSLGGTWTEERLDAYLEDPDRFAPGTSMVFPGLPDPADRAALIAHLRGLVR